MSKQESKKIDIKKVVDFWIKTASIKWDTAKVLKRSKRYADCLFFCHLTLECLLKAAVSLATKTHAPYGHDLAKFGKLTKFELSSSQKKLLSTINSFNIRARYDDYKLDFHKKATKNYTEKYFRECNQLRLWLLKKLPNKQLKNM